LVRAAEDDVRGAVGVVNAGVENGAPADIDELLSGNERIPEIGDAGIANGSLDQLLF